MLLKVGFFGLTHLGISTLAAFVNKGVKVFGFDPESTLAESIEKGQLPIEEPFLLQCLIDNRHNITLSPDKKVLEECDVVYFSLDVETDKQGYSNFKKTELKVMELISVLKPNQILVILSQVPPGFTRKISGQHQNTCYQVETLIFGQALRRAEYPERIIVGHKERTSLPVKYKFALSLFKCKILTMNYESAEFTKIAINMYLTNDIVLTNILSRLVHSQGGEWDDVKVGLQLDNRIGKNAYLNPGLGIAGGNLERDIRTLEILSSPQDEVRSLIQVFLTNSINQKSMLLNKIKNVLTESHYKISILGLAYKENTNSIKNAISIEIFGEFEKNIVGIYDPLVKLFPPAKNRLLVRTLNECINISEFLIILNRSAEFFGLESEINNSNVKFILDPLKVLDSDKLKNKCYIK
jgi:UDPglucose 6-dehydrogenase